MKKFKEFVCEINQKWWDKTEESTTVYLIGRSRGREYVRIENMGDYFNVWVIQKGLGGEFDGSLENAKKYIKHRTTLMGGGVEKLKLVKGFDVLGVNSNNY